MSLDGNGTYSPPAPQFPAIPNTVIYADDFNQIILDIATALSTAIFRDGQAAFTANQSMGGNKLTNLANGANPQDAVTMLQVATLDGVTGNIQAQLNAKFPNGGAMLDGTTAVTQPTGDSSQKVATTAFVMAAAFNAGLPAQAGNAGKFVTTDGVTGQWGVVPHYPIAALSVI